MSGLGAGGPSGSGGSKKPAKETGAQRRARLREEKAAKEQVAKDKADAKADAAKAKADADAADMRRALEEANVNAKAKEEKEAKLQRDRESGASARRDWARDKEILTAERKFAKAAGPTMPTDGDRRRSVAVEAMWVPKLESGSSKAKKPGQKPDDMARGRKKDEKESESVRSGSREGGGGSLRREGRAGSDRSSSPSSKSRGRAGDPTRRSGSSNRSSSVESKGKGKQVERREGSTDSDRTPKPGSKDRGRPGDSSPCSEPGSRRSSVESTDKTKGKGKQTGGRDNMMHSWLSNLTRDNIARLRNSCVQATSDLENLAKMSAKRARAHGEKRRRLIKDKLSKKHLEIRERTAAKEEAEARRNKEDEEAQWDYELKKLREKAERMVMHETASDIYPSAKEVQEKIENKKLKSVLAALELQKAELETAKAKEAHKKAYRNMVASTLPSDDEDDEKDGDPGHLQTHDPSPETVDQEKKTMAKYIRAELTAAQAHCKSLAATKSFCVQLLLESLKVDVLAKLSANVMKSSRDLSYEEKENTRDIIKDWGGSNLVTLREEQFTSLPFQKRDADQALAVAEMHVELWNKENEGYAIER